MESHRVVCAPKVPHLQEISTIDRLQIFRKITKHSGLVELRIISSRRKYQKPKFKIKNKSKVVNSKHLYQGNLVDHQSN